jgi:hypothetical protein
MMRSKRPDRFPRKSCDQSLMSARGLRLSCVTAKPVRSGMVELLRGRMGASQSTRQALGRACRDLEGLFASMLNESFGTE